MRVVGLVGMVAVVVVAMVVVVLGAGDGDRLAVGRVGAARIEAAKARADDVTRGLIARERLFQK